MFARARHRIGVALGLLLALLAAAVTAGAAGPPAAPVPAVPYYVAEAGVARGPLALDVLLGEIGAGRVQPWTSVWKPGLSGWIKAAALPELGAALAAAAPRPPPPPPEPPPPPADAPAEVVYFVADGGAARGPLAPEQVAGEVGAGTIGRATLVWWPGAAGWTAADDVPALAGLFAVTPPPLPFEAVAREMLVGRWEFAPAFGEDAFVRTVVSFASDGRYRAVVVVAGTERPAVEGGWSVGAATAQGFTLTLLPDGGEPGVTELRIVDRDHVVDESGGAGRRAGI